MRDIIDNMLIRDYADCLGQWCAKFFDPRPSRFMNFNGATPPKYSTRVYALLITPLSRPSRLDSTAPGMRARGLGQRFSTCF